MKCLIEQLKGSQVSVFQMKKTSDDSMLERKRKYSRYFACNVERCSGMCVPENARGPKAKVQS